MIVKSFKSFYGYWHRYSYTSLNELAHQYSNYDLVLYIIGAIKQSVILHTYYLLEIVHNYRLISKICTYSIYSYFDIIFHLLHRTSQISKTSNKFRRSCISIHQHDTLYLPTN